MLKTLHISRALISKGLVGLLLLILLLFFQGVASVSLAHAASNGEISGTLYDASNKNAPLANQPVILQMAQKTDTHDLKTVKTDSAGRYAFTALDTDQTISYVLYANYQGAQYTGSVLTLNSKPVQQSDLHVYEATTSTKNIAVTQATVLLQQPDTARGTITVSEAFSFQNLNTKTYVGSLNASTGKPNALLFSLPSGVHNITLSTGFEGYQVIQVNNGFATNAALMPGPNNFSFSYQIAYTAPSYLFSYQTQYPTVQMNFLVDPVLHATSGALSSAGMINASNHSYHSFNTATGLAAQSTINVTLDGLPAPQHASSTAPSFNSTWTWLIAALIVMVAVLVLTGFLYRSRQRSGAAASRASLRQTHRAQEAEEPAPMQSVLPEIVPAANTAKNTAQGEESWSPREKQESTLLHALLALDKSYTAGSLDKTDYEEQRASLKARLRSLMSEEASS